MKTLTQLRLAPAALLIVALSNVGCSSTQANDNSSSSDSGAENVVMDSSAESTSSMDTSTTADMTDDSAMESNAESEATATQASDDEMMANEAESAVSQDTSKSMAPEIQYNCKHDSAVRTIRVFYGATEGLACEVTYEKSSGTQTLWTAINSTDYCVEKAKQFAEKQVGWGWQCEDMDGVAVVLPEAEPEPEAVTETVSESEAVSDTEGMSEPETATDTEATTETEAAPEMKVGSEAETN